MKKNNWSRNIFFLMLFCILVGVLSTLIIFESNIILIIKEKNEVRGVKVVDGSITEGCENLNLFETSECLNRNVRILFKYNIINIGKELTFEELKEQGGVCSHYADLYYEAGKELGFNVEKISVYIDRNQPIKIKHAFAVISGKEGYCVLDGRNMNCLKLVSFEVNKEGIIENGKKI